MALLVHQGHLSVLAGCDMEGSHLGRILPKRLSPVTLEIDGVRQDQPGRGVEDARRDEVPDFPLRLLLDPGIDPLPGLLGLPGEMTWASSAP
jgi:hypothetical protein